MSNTSPIASLKSSCLTIRVTKTNCQIGKSLFDASVPDFQKLLNKVGVEVLESIPTEGIPVDICYYWWEYEDDAIDEVTQREVALLNFNKNIDLISGTWLLNQDRFLTPLSPDDKMPHPLIHIPCRAVYSEEVLLKYFPRFANIMDDSIWNYLLLWTRDFKSKFNQILKRIRETAFDNKYFYLNIAQEYAHLMARLTREAFILNKGDNGNHGSYISPFLFHSESEMRKRNTNDLLKKKEEIQNHKWHFLLLDDRFSKALQASKDDVTVNKKYILCERLNAVVDKSNYQLDCVATVDQAFEHIKKRRYEVVFIDYLLEEDYGYELLKLIDKDCQVFIENNHKSTQGYPQYVGPCGRLFFMFTSAFTTAVSERLVLEGMNRSKDYWYIGEGACPTNTPDLFDYYLTTILDKRIQDTGIYDMSPDKVYELMFEIFKPKIGDEKESVRKRANNCYQKVLSLQYHYHHLLKDVDEESGSRLATDFIKSQTYLGGLLEHLVQLVHITAFGSVRQWPELWEEFLFCKSQFDDFYLTEKDPSVLQAKKANLDTLYRSIEQHILGLKSL